MLKFSRNILITLQIKIGEKMKKLVLLLMFIFMVPAFAYQIDFKNVNDGFHKILPADTFVATERFHNMKNEDRDKLYNLQCYAQDATGAALMMDWYVTVNDRQYSYYERNCGINTVTLFNIDKNIYSIKVEAHMVSGMIRPEGRVICKSF